MKYAFSSAVLSLLWLLALPSFAASGRADYDLDDDGLIEINDWVDLNEIRNSPDGKKLHGVSTGCPAAGCNGFELSVDLNFDTNGDGKLDANDTYWNTGLGWLPGSMNAIFEGNGHIIRNLMVNRPATSNVGLFGIVSNASIRNLGLGGKLTSLVGNSYVGGLVGVSSGTATTITGCFTTGKVQAVGSYAGGLIGNGSVTFQSVFSSAVVSANMYVGGVQGQGSSSTFTGAYSVGRVVTPPSSSYMGGISGLWGSATNSYWATDAAGQTSQGPGMSGAKAATLAQLKCPTAADNTSCLMGTTLYSGWALLKNSKGANYWDFGSTSQLPGLVLNGVVYRDSDGDGYLDADDTWSTNYAAALDSDGDGAPDQWTLGCDSTCQAASGLVLDQVPNSAAAIIDADLDGFPDAWAASCNTACQTASGLVLDTKLNDADNDGIVDTIDTDINNDGNLDADSNHNGLIEVSSLAQLDAVRNNLSGLGRQLTAAGAVDSSGCPVSVSQGVTKRVCSGYELTQSLDFDTNGDGKLDASDSYWNTGLGWETIGSSNAPYSAIFEGNGFVIRNLMINRPDDYYQGLFAATRNAKLRNLGLTGSLFRITGFSYLGGLAGWANSTEVVNCFATGAITSTVLSSSAYSGGLLGGMDGSSSVTGSFSTGSVQAVADDVGGLVGYTNGTLNSVFSSASVTGGENVGGLIGQGSSAKITAAYATGKVNGSRSYYGGLVGYGGAFAATYWAQDTTAQDNIGGSNSNTNSSGATLAQLKCPTAADNTACLSGTTLYVGWGALKDSKGAAYWNFGTSTDLPGLVLNGVVYRDNDSDGVLDADDKWPTNSAAGVDSDNDGAPDRWSSSCNSACQTASGLTLDQFPTNAAASVDLDLDGKPDAWNTSCNSACQTASGLVLDTQLNDSDNDGIVDSADTDINGDGTLDADKDHDGLIEVSSLVQLDAIRNNTFGTGRKLTSEGLNDSSGCGISIINGTLQRACQGYELTQSLDFDTNADGKLDASDSYWNTGLGWVAIVDLRATFEGNGYLIRNLMINRPTSYEQGLFAYANNATLRNIGLTGKLMSITGAYNLGGLVGAAYNTAVQNAFATGAVVSTSDSSAYAGGLVGYARNGSLMGCFATGSVQAKGGTYVGGLLGYGSSVNLTSVFASASVSGNDYVGGVLGYPDSSTITAAYAVGRVSSANLGWAISREASVNSYWASDVVGVVGDASSATAATLAQLKCPTAADNTSCLSGATLYKEWAALQDSKGAAYWSFGTNTQLPGLVLNGVTYRDNDGDGYLDTDDVLPNNAAAGLDADGDGAPDRWAEGCDSACQTSSGLVLDQFPTKAAASVDLDLDGKPDAWNASCNSACQTASGLVLDTKPNDYDNDGVLDSVDTDINGDGMTDADADHNGFIDISTLAQLDAVRYNLKGTGRQLSANGTVDSSGCGVLMIDGFLKRGCIGYELTKDLDFDTNTDGKLDASDSYWNAGLGWVAIGDTSTPFNAIFEGNGHVIRNLMINRPTASNQGLMAATSGASIRNLGITGKLMSINGASYVGGLVGYSSGSTSISNSFVTGAVVASNTSSSYVGGLAGYFSGGKIVGSFTTGSVLGASGYVGGLVGSGSTTAQAVFSSASVTGGEYVGGLFGYSSSVYITAAYAVGKVTVTKAGGYSGAISGIFGNTTNSYWAVDATTQSSQGVATSGAAGVTLAQLKCPTAADNATCVLATTLYVDWASLKDSKGNTYWNFGSATQLPGLVLNGVIYRDGDGDGYLDADDTWPTQYAAYIDSDGDSAPDSWTPACDSACQTASGLVLDQFPKNAAASVDADLDGKPDAWNATCNTACQTASGLVLDTLPNDGDNDGISDSADTDSNGDGVTDADADHNGLLEVSSWAQLDAMRYNLAGTGRQLGAAAAVDSSGCPVVYSNGLAQRVCNGYELTKDLDFDTNTDGKLDASDSYWNVGLGWVAIGTQATPFTAVFDGNNHVIRNLMINRPSTSYQGLFGSARSAQLRNLGMNGARTSITGSSNVGGLAGYLDSTTVQNCYVSGAIAGTTNIGGLAGVFSGTGALTGSFTTGSVVASGDYAGGLAGRTSEMKVQAAFTTASVTAANYVGGLVGYGSSSGIFNGTYATGKVTATGTRVGAISGLWGTVTNSHWATDTAHASIGTGLSSTTGSRGATLEKLKCPTSADNTTCVSGATLYAGWGDLKDAKGNAYWDFGTSSQLPALVFNGIVMRDTDGDGLLDIDDPDIDNDGLANAQDKLPLNAAASVDTDGDGSPDSWNGGCDSTCQANSGLKLDSWPNNAAVALDNDGDGVPDAWSPNCNTACQTASGLTLDAFPLLVSVSLDADGDSAPDVWNANCDANCKTAAQAAMVRLDAFPTKAAVSVDADGDGVADSWNASCNTACQTASGLTLDAFPTKVAASVDTDGDGFPNAWNASCNTACQTASGLTLDALPNNAAASVDIDGDAMPDAWNTSCNTSCQAASGLMLDAFSNNKAASVDTDSDGSPDSWNLGCDTTCKANSGLKLDAFPTKVAASVDSDGDGMPDAWNASCNASCQIASLLVIDQLPNNKAASVDKDGDGSPDSWNLSCDASCKAASGLALDAFPTNKAASVDLDGDGRPDAWGASCNTACQTSSGLTLDILLNDKDNDGVPDTSDTDNSSDNGKPTIVAVPEDINIAATGATTLVTLIKADVSAFDAVDSQLILEVSNGSQLLILDANNQVALPSGAIKLRWVAVDDAGNRSDAVEQVVNVYPQVQFAKKQDVTGEKANAKLVISFSGAVPVYPVKLTFSWVTGESTAVAADVNTTAETGIDLNKLVLTINNAEELAKAALTIPVLEDALVENDETMTFDIASASAGNESPFSLPIVETSKRTVLTITELNLAPTAVLSMTQAGKVTSLIDPKGGAVDVTSVVTDLNGKDKHSYMWDTTGLPVSGLDKATYSFDPLKMANGSYNLSLTVTDNGLPPLSSEKVTLKFEVKGQSSSSSNSTSSSSSSSSAGTGTSPETGGGSGGGGGSIDFLLLFLLCSLGFRFRVAKR